MLWVRLGWPNWAPFLFVAQVVQNKTLKGKCYHFLVILNWSFFLCMPSDFKTGWSCPSISPSLLSPHLPVYVLPCLPSPGEEQICWDCPSVMWGHIQVVLALVLALHFTYLGCCCCCWGLYFISQPHYARWRLFNLSLQKVVKEKGNLL